MCMTNMKQIINNHDRNIMSKGKNKKEYTKEHAIDAIKIHARSKEHGFKR